MSLIYPVYVYKFRRIQFSACSIPLKLHWFIDPDKQSGLNNGTGGDIGNTNGTKPLKPRDVTTES